jgi:flagellar biosynthesis protein FlhF
MRIKSYFANTVTDAVQSARREMGDEAMLVETRQAPPESRHLGSYEVVFGATAPEQPGPAAALAQPVTAPLAPHEWSRLHTEMSQMRRQLEGIRLAMRSGLTAPRGMPPSSSLAETFSTLLAAEISADVAQTILDRLHRQLSPAQLGDPAELKSALAMEMESRFTVDATIGRASASPRIAALVGPPGSGKTTSLVKLAVTYGVAARKTVQIISLDNLRVGGADQLRSYAAILGVGFQALESPAGLAQALEDYSHKSVILIDTPGYCRCDLDGAAGLAHVFSRSDIDVHLVLSASMKAADLTRVVEAFEVFRPAKLLFTRLDETDSFGPIYSEAARTQKALSFFGTGQRIPEDLRQASRGWLIEMILLDPQGAERQAA